MRVEKMIGLPPSVVAVMEMQRRRERSEDQKIVRRSGRKRRGEGLVKSVVNASL